MLKYNMLAQIDPLLKKHSAGCEYNYCPISDTSRVGVWGVDLTFPHYGDIIGFIYNHSKYCTAIQ